MWIFSLFTSITIQPNGIFKSDKLLLNISLIFIICTVIGKLLTGLFINLNSISLIPIGNELIVRLL